LVFRLRSLGRQQCFRSEYYSLLSLLSLRSAQPHFVSKLHLLSSHWKSTFIQTSRPRINRFTSYKAAEHGTRGFIKLSHLVQTIYLSMLWTSNRRSRTTESA